MANLHVLYSYSVWFSFIFIIQIFITATTFAQSDNYIIYMDLSAMPKAFLNRHTWYSATLQSVSENTNPVSDKLLYSYNYVINGFSAILTPSELDTLKNSPGYISSIKDLPVRPDTTHSPQFLGLNPNSGAWPVSNFGRDVIIGLVDTGVWPESESFNDNGMSEIPSRWKGQCDSGIQFNSSLCNKKLIGARFFNKGLIAHYPNATISMNSTRDTEGHGTHTSSTAAGNYVDGASYFGYASGTAKGMAPLARVAMYKALWEEGAYASDMIAAIDQAIIDGVDVLSLSLGLDGVALYEDPVALATFSAVDKNIFVSTSAGNQGPYLESLHNGIPWVLTVAAGTMDRQVGASLTLFDGVSLTGSSLYPGFNSSNPFPIVFMDQCHNSTEIRKVGQKIVVCQDKNGSISEQFDSIADAKVAGGIFISDDNDLEYFLQSSFPAIIMKSENGEIIKDYINDNLNPKAIMEFRKTETGTKPAPSVAVYSSRGPSVSCPFVLKPDLMAPGDLVLAAWPSKTRVTEVESRSVFSKFNLLSGTSMSCPHATGVAALLRGAHPDWSPAAIRSAMMTTSDSVDNTNSPIKDIGDDYKPATPLAMGAGHINPNKALDPGLVYNTTTDDYVNLLCAMNFTMKQIQSITKSTPSTSFKCSRPSLDINYPSFIGFFNASDSRTVREFRRTVTNVGEGMSIYNANVTPIEGFKISVNPSKLIFRSKNEKQNYKLILAGPAKMGERVAFGHLSWIEIGGNHVVKSPIVATSLSTDPLIS